MVCEELLTALALLWVETRFHAHCSTIQTARSHSRNTHIALRTSGTQHTCIKSLGVVPLNTTISTRNRDIMATTGVAEGAISLATNRMSWLTTSYFDGIVVFLTASRQKFSRCFVGFSVLRTARMWAFQLKLASLAAALKLLPYLCRVIQGWLATNDASWDLCRSILSNCWLDLR